MISITRSPVLTKKWLFFFLLVFGAGFAHAQEKRVVRVFAAASLSNALTEVGMRYDRGEVKFSFAGSSTLARQIEQGAPVDVFISANPAWMDYLEKYDLIAAGSRDDILGNRLVVVTPVDEPLEVRAEIGAPFGQLFSGRLAIADPDHVPAGMYAQKTLMALSWWNGVKDRLAPGQDVRVALAFVERGACPVGIVYATDAAVSNKVSVAARLPDLAGGPIRYPVAIVVGHDSPEVRAFVAFLRAAEATAIFEGYGFLVVKGGD